MKQPIKKHTYSTLITDLASLIEQGRKTAVRYVNTVLVSTYWLMGRRIVEYEQKGKERAEYGEALLKKLAKDLSPKYGKGFSERNLELMRKFYLAYPISQTLSAKLSKPGNKQTLSAELSEIIQTPSKESTLPLKSPKGYTLSAKFPLSWSHYCLLMRLDEPFQREFYEAECVGGNWSVRQLDRQIQSMLYERTALSKRKLAVIAKAHEKPILLKPEDKIKDPYILEFLGLKDEYSESQLEDALIHKDKEKLSEENDPVGLILCTGKKKTVVEYAFGGMNNKIFASKYKLQLPAPEVLKTEIEHEKQRLLEMKITEATEKGK